MIKLAIYAHKSKLKLHSIVNYYSNLNPFDYILCYFYNIVQIMSTNNKSATLKVLSKNTIFSMTMATFFNVVKSKGAEIKTEKIILNRLHIFCNCMV
jgi:hypothetical protein